MAQNKALEVWNGLPTWAKGVIAVGGVAVVYFTTRSILKSIKRKSEQRDAQITVNQQSQDLRNLLNTGGKATYPDSQYRAWADKIQTQFTGVDFGQNLISKDVPLIGMWSSSGRVTRDIINQLKNNVDFLKLSQAWGMRSYDLGAFMGTFRGNLTQAIADELDRGEILALNDILKKKGITYQL